MHYIYITVQNEKGAASQQVKGGLDLVSQAGLMHRQLCHNIKDLFDREDNSIQQKQTWASWSG